MKGHLIDVETAHAAAEVDRMRGKTQRVLPFKEGEFMHHAKADMVNNPPHYNKYGVECIDAIKATLDTNFIAYCIGNAMKYIWRHSYKGKPKEDLRKAVWYLNRAIDELPDDT